MRSSQIFRGKVTHERMSPERHTFTYPSTFFAFNLNELGAIAKQSFLFGHNTTAALTIHDKDYLQGKPLPILQQLDEWIPHEADNEYTILITSPRYFSYAFNPVNFHLRMRGEQLTSVVAEVNNTFGDRHLYPLTELEELGNFCWTASCPKNFHVSPFNNMDGEYHFTFRVAAQEVFLGVDLHRDGACVLKTWIQGSGKPITSAAIWRHALLKPFNTAVNSMPRILWQAAQLYYKKKLKLFTRPIPKSQQTVVDRDESVRRQQVI